jgi:glutamate carboxypeptidase
VIDLLRRLVAIESPSDHPAGCRAVLELLAAEFAVLGGGLEWHTAADERPVLISRWGQQSPTLLIGHVDTVFPLGELVRRPFTVRDGKAFGPGVFDMKAGLAQLVEALRLLTAEPQLTVLLNADEELGSPGSEPFLVAEAARAGCALVIEPSGPAGAMKTARKGIGLYDLEVLGVAAHPGLDFDSGVNAIVELAGRLGELAGLTDLDEGSTVNVGKVQGGTGRNVVPARAVAELETRFWTVAAGERLDAAIRQLLTGESAAELRLTGGVHRQPMVRDQATGRLAELARACARADGWQVEELAVGGVSDGNVVAALGLPTLDGIGAEGGGAHGPDEWVSLDAMPRRARWLAAVLDRLPEAAHAHASGSPMPEASGSRMPEASGSRMPEASDARLPVHDEELRR